MPESKSKFLIPAVGTALVVAGGIAAYMYFKGGPSGDISSALGAAKVVPDEAILATYISTDPKVWAKLEQFGTPEAQKVISKGLEDLNKNLSSDNSISYEKDLKPWVGGVMIAMLPPSPAKTAAQNAPQASQEPNILMVVGIKDKISALNFANKLKAQKGVKVQEADYKGEKIIETTGKGEPNYTAVLNNTHIVIAPEKQAVEHAIDTYKGEPSFATKEGANSMLTSGVNVDNTLAQIYVPDYGSMVQQLIAANPNTTPIPPQTMKQLKQMKSMVAGVGIDNAGVRMKAVAKLDPQLVKYQYQNTSAQVLSQLPADTIALLSGQGISNWWSALVEQSKDVPELRLTLEQARAQLKLVNLDLDKEIFGWMDGEFGFAAIPSNQGVLAQVGFGGALVFHTSDRKTAEATLNKLDDLVKSQSVNVAKRSIGGKEVTEWQIPQQGALLAHGWLDNDSVFVTIGGPIAETLADRKGQSLDGSDSFKAVTNTLQKPNGGYFFLDMDKTAPLLNRLATAQQQPMTPEASAIMSSIRGLGITATSPDKTTTQVEMLLALKPKTGN
ncbi:metalloendopeptidase [Nostocales cyanobacterium HT-58-2]|nr:metalloendopeptidase [Nostocales cyanobacterium HT-58-2]